MSEYVWIFYNRQDSEYASYNKQREIIVQVRGFLLRYSGIQNPEPFVKIQLLSIFAEGFEYVSGFKYVRVLNIGKFS